MNKEPYFDENKIFRHPCSVEDCPNEGCIGENVDLLKGRLGRWYCNPHHKAFEQKQKMEQPEIRPAELPRQGRLL